MSNSQIECRYRLTRDQKQTLIMNLQQLSVRVLKPPHPPEINDDRGNVNYKKEDEQCPVAPRLA